MTPAITALWASIAQSSLLWVTLTLLAYLGALWLYQLSGGKPFLVPVLTGSALVVGALLLSATPYTTYFEATKPIHFLTGTAMVALAVPLYGQIERLKQIWLPVCVALLAGSATAIVSAIWIAQSLGGSVQTAMSLAPKSATMPIAMAVAERFGGLASLAAVAVAATGILGTIMAYPLLAALRIRDPAVRGFAIGITAHAIGTAREIQNNPTSGAFAALAMGLNGVLTALLMPLLLYLLAAVGGL